MYVQRNSVTLLRNRFAVETQQCTLCVVVVVVVVIVVDLHVTVKYITILNVTQQCFYGNFVTDNNANYK
jgi:hypothetical protein